MIKTEPIHINKWLLPLSWLYGLIIYMRNRFFDWGILKHEEFDVPVICIGNITVGGTGKTPHTEYLIQLLQSKYRVGVLSRGYMRESNGYILATSESTSKEIGDEPFQIKQKFPKAIVAVDGNRRRGIHNMLSLENPPEIILLDDAFQHRYVKPSFTIILCDYNRPIDEDTLLPAGRLREPVTSTRKANMLIVTKCPEDIQPIDFRIISHSLNVFPYQNLYFTKLIYKGLKPVFEDVNSDLPLDALKDKHILLVTGIASPKTILKKLSEYTDKVETMTYGDHYNFKEKDIRQITDTFRKIASNDKIILVTEKDAARFVMRKDIDDDIKMNLYYLPIEISFLDNEDDFKERIYKHVKGNTRNSGVHKK